MPDLPHYPSQESGDDLGVAGDQRPKRRSSGWTYLLWAVAAVLVAGVVVLHLTGVLGPGGH